MPTPMRFYGEAAKKWGGIDPADTKAVESFFAETFSSLPAPIREEILRFLLSNETSPAVAPTPEEIAAKEAAQREHLAEKRKASALRGAATRKARIAARAAMVEPRRR